MGYMGYIVHTHIYGYDIVQIGQITLPMSDLSWYVPYTTYTLYVRFQKRTFQTKVNVPDKSHKTDVRFVRFELFCPGLPGSKWTFQIKRTKA